MSRNILFLGPDSDALEFLRGLEEIEVTAINTKISKDVYANLPKFDLVVSYSYRYIIRPYILNDYKGRIINLHISYLPYNRGADPNIWSFILDTPKGVTIHHMDEGLDTGDIIAQKLVPMSADETLESSYFKLREAMTDTLKTLILEEYLVNGKIPAGTAQEPLASSSDFTQKTKRSKDKLFDPSGPFSSSLSVIPIMLVDTKVPMARNTPEM